MRVSLSRTCPSPSCSMYSNFVSNPLWDLSVTSRKGDPREYPESDRRPASTESGTSVVSRRPQIYSPQRHEPQRYEPQLCDLTVIDALMWKSSSSRRDSPPFLYIVPRLRRPRVRFLVLRPSVDGFSSSRSLLPGVPDPRVRPPSLGPLRDGLLVFALFSSCSSLSSRSLA